MIPKLPFARVQLHEVLPGDAPRAGTYERAVRAAQYPIRMILMEGGTPTGVIDDEVEEQPRPLAMDRAGQLAKLGHARGPPVEVDERRINRGQIESGIRAADAAETRVGRRGWVDRQEMENAAAERVDDVRQFADEVAEFARRRNDRVALFVQLL